jgi:hypothetical protein
MKNNSILYLLFGLAGDTNVIAWEIIEPAP